MGIDIPVSVMEITTTFPVLDRKQVERSITTFPRSCVCSLNPSKANAAQRKEEKMSFLILPFMNSTTSTHRSRTALETVCAYMAVVREEKTEKRKGVMHDA